MKALTIHQPWASLIAWGLKPIENRSWKPHARMLGELIAIHAGKRLLDDDAIRERLRLCLSPSDYERTLRRQHDLGAVIAVVRLGKFLRIEDAHTLPTSEVPWFIGPWGWELQQVQALPEPVPASGRQLLWDLPSSVELAVRRQLVEPFRAGQAASDPSHRNNRRIES